MDIILWIIFVFLIILFYDDPIIDFFHNSKRKYTEYFCISYILFHIFLYKNIISVIYILYYLFNTIYYLYPTNNVFSISLLFTNFLKLILLGYDVINFYNGVLFVFVYTFIFLITHDAKYIIFGNLALYIVSGKPFVLLIILSDILAHTGYDIKSFIIFNFLLPY